MTWKRGPLPPNTWMWGGVVEIGGSRYGFHFADFHGDHVKVETIKNGKLVWRRVEADQVAWYDNSIELPLPAEPLVGTRISEAEEPP